MSQPPPDKPPHPLDYATPRQVRLVTIRSFADSFEANLALELLRAEGISGFLADQNMVAIGGGLYTNMVGGIRLQVPEEDAERALQLLPQPRNRRPVICPRCGSEDLICSHFLGWKTVLPVLLLLGLPLIFTPPPCCCRACGHRWRQNSRESQDSDNDE